MTRGSILGEHTGSPERTTRHPGDERNQVLLLSSNSILAEGLRGILARDPRLEFQAIADPRISIGLHGLRVLLIDTGLPFPSWQHLLQKDPPCSGISSVLVVSGLFVRDCLAAQLSPHAQFLCADQHPASILGELLQIAGLQPLPERTERSPAEGILTRREIDTLRCVAQGKLNKEISGELGISLETVKYHLKNIQAKLQAPNRVSAVLTAIRSGWIPMPRDPL